ISDRWDCEVRSVIRFLLAKKHKPIEFFWQLCEVYGDNIITEGGVRQWCIKFKNGQTNVHDEQRSGYPNIVTDELVAKVDDKIRENRRFTVTELLLSFPQISRSLLHEIVTQKLGYHKFCARWVPKILTENHKSQRMAALLTFLYSYDKDGDSFLDQIVTGDETWVKHVNSETKLEHTTLTTTGNCGQLPVPVQDHHNHHNHNHHHHHHDVYWPDGLPVASVEFCSADIFSVCPEREIFASTQDRTHSPLIVR
uniref:Mos1 transposase HTH domain-containing protein n=1 Tax=Laticauda laticaudata TaxID=8630 RepID=A0A8C5SQD0_LATLA